MHAVKNTFSDIYSRVTADLIPQMTPIGRQIFAKVGVSEHWMKHFGVTMEECKKYTDIKQLSDANVLCDQPKVPHYMDKILKGVEFKVTATLPDETLVATQLFEDVTTKDMDLDEDDDSEGEKTPDINIPKVTSKKKKKKKQKELEKRKKQKELEKQKKKKGKKRKRSKSPPTKTSTKPKAKKRKLSTKTTTSKKSKKKKKTKKSKSDKEEVENEETSEDEEEDDSEDKSTDEDVSSDESLSDEDKSSDEDESSEESSEEEKKRKKKKKKKAVKPKMKCVKGAPRVWNNVTVTMTATAKDYRGVRASCRMMHTYDCSTQTRTNWPKHWYNHQARGEDEDKYYDSLEKKTILNVGCICSKNCEAKGGGVQTFVSDTSWFAHMNPKRAEQWCGGHAVAIPGQAALPKFARLYGTRKEVLAKQATDPRPKYKNKPTTPSPTKSKKGKKKSGKK